MSQEHLARFRAIVLRDPVLQRQLRVVTDRSAFASAMVTLADAHECTITLADVEAALAEARSAWYERWV
jgi:hypothetical protein